MPQINTIVEQMSIEQLEECIIMQAMKMTISQYYGTNE